MSLGDVNVLPLRGDVRIFEGPDGPSGVSSLLFDPVSDSYFQLSAREASIASRFTARESLASFMDKAVKAGLDFSEAEVSALQASLLKGSLLDIPHGSGLCGAGRPSALASAWGLLISSYVFLKIPLMRPDAFLTASFPAVRTIFNRWTVLVVAAFAFAGYAAAVSDLGRVVQSFRDSISFAGAARYLVVIVLLKIGHELAHAYAAKLCGVRVRRFGVAFVFLLPRLYTDLTDVWRVKDRRMRALVDGAGILSELVVGGLAALIWSDIQPGAISTLCFHLFTVSLIGTLVVNANPFIGFDGYYVLMDLLGVDNLRPKGVAVLRDFLRFRLFGIEPAARAAAVSPLERRIALIYGACSCVYRFFLYISFVVIVYFMFFKALGVVLAIVEAWLFLVRPVVAEIRALRPVWHLASRKMAFTSAMALSIPLLILFAPLPWGSSYPCVVSPSSFEILYVSTPGFLSSSVPFQGVAVPLGFQVARLEDRSLSFLRDESALELAALRVEFDSLRSYSESLAQAKVKLSQLKAKEEELAELDRRLGMLQLKSGRPGRVAVFEDALRTGRWLRRGEAAAEVFDPLSPSVKVYVPESALNSFLPGSGVLFYLPGEILPRRGVVSSADFTPVLELGDSPILSDRGGPLAVEPSQRGAQSGARRLTSPVFEISVRPSSSVSGGMGRSGLASSSCFESAGLRAVRRVAVFLRREFAI